jgi:hypothetical protein
MREPHKHWFAYARDRDAVRGIRVGCRGGARHVAGARARIRCARTVRARARVREPVARVCAAAAAAATRARSARRLLASFSRRRPVCARDVTRIIFFFWTLTPIPIVVVVSSRLCSSGRTANEIICNRQTAVRCYDYNVFKWHSSNVSLIV